MKGAIPAAARRPAIHEPAARSTTEDDLPVAHTEIELSAPPIRLVLAEPSTRTPKILAQIRPHTHPLGNRGVGRTHRRGWATHAPTVWSTMREAVNAHLAADGLPQVSDFTLHTTLVKEAGLQTAPRRAP